MARHLRSDSLDSWHHVMNRGAKKELLFFDDTDRAFFVSLLHDLDADYGVEIHAYCLMGNHYHLLLQSRSQQLSEAMKWLGLCYAKRFNWRHGFDGSPFRGRYHERLVKTDQHLVAAARYIHRNPLDLGVARLADYKWSSLGAYLPGHQPPRWLQTDYVLRLSGGAAGYERFVGSDNPSADAIVDSNGESPVRPGPGPSTNLKELESVARAVLTSGPLAQRWTVLGTAERQRLLQRVALILAVDDGRAPMSLIAAQRGLRSNAAARATVSTARKNLAASELALAAYIAARDAVAGQHQKLRRGV